MKLYTFAPISAREYPTVRLLDHPSIWGGVRFCVNLSEKPYSPELSAAMATHGIEWIHCPVSEKPGADWLNSFSKALPKVYLAFKEGKRQIIHCDFGNNRSRSLVEAFYFAVNHKEFDDPYKGADNHLEYNCIQGHLPDLGEWERRMYALTSLFEDGKVAGAEQMSQVLLSPSPRWARGGAFTFFTKSNEIFSGSGYCATPFYDEIHDAVENYHNGRPVGDRVTVDEVQVRVLDEWKRVGAAVCDGKESDISVPCLVAEGETAPMEMSDEEDIEGFIPERGHEYLLRVRRIFLTEDPFFHHYELMELISDKLTT